MFQKYFKKNCSIILFLILTTNLFSTSHAENKYFKDIENHWSKKYIISLNDRNIINGYPDDTFKPDNYITRIESFTLMAKSFYENNEENENILYNFSDSYNIPFWAQKYINTLFINKIVYGGINTYIYPKDFMTRLDFTIYISKILELDYPNENAKLDFKDNKYIEKWSIIPIYNVTKTGILSGYTDNTFRPENKITRGEISKIIYNSIEFLNQSN